MNAATASMEYVQASLPFVDTGACERSNPEPGKARRATKPPLHLIRSVVEEAGMGRFVYLQGRSGHRYVFSSMDREEAQLFGRALFAIVGTRGDVQVAARMAAFTGKSGSIYVHFLDQDERQGDGVLDDLCR